MARKPGEHSQGVLPLHVAPAASDLLLGSCNRGAVNAVLERPWAGALYLEGPAKSGKSLIASMWVAEGRGRLVAAAKLGVEDTADLLETGGVAVDAAEALRAGGEEALFHLFNALARGGGRLLLTGRLPPRGVALTLSDLATRLRSIPVARIEPPDDAFLAAFLARLAEARQLNLPEAVVAYLQPRMARSQEAAINLIEALDRLSLEGGRPVTRELAAEALKMAEN